MKRFHSRRGVSVIEALVVVGLLVFAAVASKGYLTTAIAGSWVNIARQLSANPLQ